MSLHKGMKFIFVKGKAKGRVGVVAEVSGNEIFVITNKSQYWVNKSNLEKRIKWRK